MNPQTLTYFNITKQYTHLRIFFRTIQVIGFHFMKIRLATAMFLKLNF